MKLIKITRGHTCKILVAELIQKVVAKNNFITNNLL